MRYDDAFREYEPAVVSENENVRMPLEYSAGAIFATTEEPDKTLTVVFFNAYEVSVALRRLPFVYSSTMK